MLLAIDTSTAQIGLALYDGNSVRGEFVCSSGQHHTRELAPALARLLSGCEVMMEDLRVLAAATGPGSFTSLRVGLAFIKGLALARHLPLIGIPTLDIMAASIPLSERRLAAILQAGRGRLAVGWYQATADGWRAEGPAQVTTAEDLEKKIRTPVLICGELTADNRATLGRKYKNVVLSSPAQCVRRPGILAEIAWQRWQAGKVDTAAVLSPIYIHVAGGLPA